MNFRKTIYSLAAGCSMATMTMAQQDLTLFMMHNMMQSSEVNVLATPDSNQIFSLGLPGISATSLSVTHDGFVYNDLINRRADDSLELDLENVFSKMKDINTIGVNFQTDLLSMRLKAGKNLFSFNITEKINVGLDYPKSLFELLYYGNGSFVGETVNITGLGINAMYYREVAVGWNRSFGNILVGVRPKLLFGISNVWTETSNISLYTDANNYDLTLSTAFLIHSAGVPLTADTSGFGLSSDFDLVNFMFNNKNLGGAVDLGVAYHLTDKAIVSAAVNDIGAISWKSNITDFKQEGASFTYSGVDLSELVSGDSSNFAKELVDSITGTFVAEMDTNASSYTTVLPMKINLSASYNITPKNTVSVLLRGVTAETGFKPSFTLGYVKQFGRVWNVGLSYSIKDNTYNNLGFASVLKLGNVQFNLITDNVLAYFMPASAKGVDLRFGFNIMVYQRKHTKVPDKPDF